MEQYESLRKIAAGGFATIYLCKRKDTKELIADESIETATFKDEERTRLNDEVKNIEKLRNNTHINVSTFFDHVECGTVIHLYTEFCGGGTLEAELQRRKAPKVFIEREVLCFIHQIASGLAFIHDKNVVHGDLKPDNILFSSDGRLKITKFGTSAILARNASSLGTILYRSPEVVKEEKYSPASDVWSLGVIVYELATFRNPFRAKTDAGVIKKIMNKVPDNLGSKASEQLRTLVKSMIDKEPDSRPSCQAITETDFVQAQTFSTDQQKELLKKLKLAKTTLHDACRNQELASVRYLIAAGEDPSLAETKSTDTPLMLAATTGNVVLVMLLLDRQVDVNSKNSQGWTALHKAAWVGCAEVVRLLVQMGAETDVIQEEEFTAMHLAAWNGHVEAVQVLAELGAKVNVRLSTGANPLYVAAQNGHVEVVRVLVGLGGNINARADNKCVPLHVAAHNGHIEVVRALVELKADIKATTVVNETPLQIALRKGHTELRAILTPTPVAAAVPTPEKNPK